MAKSKSIFVCQECGYESLRWLGKCPACNTWNTFLEEQKENTSNSVKNVINKKILQGEMPKNIVEIKSSEKERIKTNLRELD